MKCNKLRLLILFGLAALLANGIIAQEVNSSNVRNNWISGELNLFGIGARYERMLNSHFSVGVNAYGNLIFMGHYGVTGNLRYYPLGRNFFFGLGLGLQSFDADFFPGSRIGF